MMGADWVSVGNYARHAGITVQAVYRRLHAGHLGDGARRHGGRYLIQPAAADAAFADRGRPCNSRHARLEARLMLLPDQLAEELEGEDATYIRVALLRHIGNLILD